MFKSETMVKNILVAIVACAIVHQASTRRSASTCGVSKSKLGLIVRGEDFPRGSFPWIVALMSTRTKPPTFFCAGTLISRTFVISAAHCILDKGKAEKVLPRDVRAFFGAHDLSDPTETDRIVLSPTKISIHDDWNQMTESYDADVSLLEFLKNKIPFNAYIQPICLWDSETEPSVTEGVVTGWGKSEDASKFHENVPKLIPAKIQNNEDCFFDEKKLYDLSSKRTFCAGLRNGSGVCSGDSGGGLFVKVSGVYYLRGIVSSSLIREASCDVWKNAVYTNVLKFKTWIGEITGRVLETSTKVLKNNLEGALATSTQAVRKLFCSFERSMSNCCGLLNSCILKQPILTDDYILGYKPHSAHVEGFEIINNTEVRFIPGNIGKELPSLKEFQITGCGLTVVRDHYFKDMKKLRHLRLTNNKIASIESNAFRDLISVTFMHLEDNKIETLDEKLFATMVNLVFINLEANKISYLNPTTFRITDRNINIVSLGSNVCLNKQYNYLDDLESDIKTFCSRRLDD